MGSYRALSAYDFMDGVDRIVKPQLLYEELKQLAERLGVTVSEQNFRTTGIRVRSGFCRVKNKDHCIIDKHLKISKKLDVLGECISRFDHETVYVLPAVREFLDQFKRVDGISGPDGSRPHDSKSDDSGSKTDDSGTNLLSETQKSSL